MLSTSDPGDRVRRGVPSVRAKYYQRRRTWLEHSADWTGDGHGRLTVGSLPARVVPPLHQDGRHHILSASWLRSGCRLLPGRPRAYVDRLG
ncbi:unnamed protein product, partial [Ectocarpus sp. 8 AP-2014]